MTETKSETPNSVEGARLLPDNVRRQLIVVRGHSGLLYEELDPWLVQNQEQFGRGTDNYVAMVQVHGGSKMGSGEHVLGIQEEVRKKCAVMINGKEIEFVEANPKVRNIWVGEYVRLLTPNEAADTPYAGQTALKWATIGGQSPEMVVKASNGSFYPATSSDVVISPKS